MASLTQPVRIDELVARLDAVDVAKVNDSLGTSILDKLTRVRQSFFNDYLAKAAGADFDDALGLVFGRTLKTEDLGSANRFLQSADKKFLHDEVETTSEGNETRKNKHNISSLAKAFKYRLALKLLFALINPSMDLSSNQAISRVSLLMKCFSLSATELSEDGAGCIWECRFKSHIAEKLAAADDQIDDIEIYEGEEVNIHKVLAVVEYPSLHLLRSRMLEVLCALHASPSGA